MRVPFWIVTLIPSIQKDRQTDRRPHWWDIIDFYTLQLTNDGKCTHLFFNSIICRFALIKAIKKPDDRWACTYANKNMQEYWDSFYKYYDSIMYSYLPLSTMLVFNVAIVTKLVVAKMKRSSDMIGGTSLSKTSYSVTVMLVRSINHYTLPNPYPTWNSSLSLIFNLKFQFQWG